MSIILEREIGSPWKADGLSSINHIDHDFENEQDWANRSYNIAFSVRNSRQMTQYSKKPNFNMYDTTKIVYDLHELIFYDLLDRSFHFKYFEAEDFSFTWHLCLCVSRILPKKFSNTLKIADIFSLDDH